MPTVAAHCCCCCCSSRALDSFKQLLQDKSHCLAHPDVLISAVGTKIYNYSPESGWREDKGWVEQLDVGWRVEAVREAAYAALAKVGVGVHKLFKQMLHVDASPSLRWWSSSSSRSLQWQQDTS